MLLAALLIGSGQARAIDTKKPPSFGTLDVASADAVKTQAQAWLKAAGKTDAATADKFEAIWKQTDRPVLDRLADSFALGNADAAQMMMEARDQLAPAPTKVPDLLKNDQMPAFLRANLGLA
jgi:hypothetical protein